MTEARQLHTKPIPFVNLSETKREQFLSKISKEENGCWNWTGCFQREGYGKFSIHQKWYRAHRISYWIHFGDVIGNLHVCHKCDNRKCVNPDHLFLGTDKDNHQDCVQKGRQNRGEKNGKVVLTEKQVLEIRALREQGWLQKQLVEKFGVTQGAISFILRRVNWRHI